MTPPITIEVASIPDLELREAMDRLLPQLLPSAACPSTPELVELLNTPGTTLLLARDASPQRRIVGALTLIVFRIPTGLRAWIEDVVVDENSRGQGVGRALVEDAVRRAREKGALAVNLTSSPAREAANQLYRRLGFEIRETNAYRLPLDAAESGEESDLGFSFQARKSGEVEIAHHGRLATTLRGTRAKEFLEEVEAGDNGDAQQVMARWTGNYKRGNERVARNHPRNRE